ncbi:MAG: lipocalin-like domain-containing protein [Aggregatilineales bacterium]
MPKWWLIGIGAVVVIAALAVGAAQLQGQAAPSYHADVIAALNNNGDSAGFARALAVRDFHFPQDYGAHPDYQTEWWYYTGNLAGADGRRFGFEFTIFRRALAPPGSVAARASDWATNQLYFADLALTDVQGGQFYSAERFSRGAAGLAGALIDPNVRIWIDNWTMDAQTVDATVMRLRADAGSDAPITLDLTTTQLKPPALEGDRGLSAKSPTSGDASYYYSLTRLATAGSLIVNGQPYTVSGLSWMDHEFSTSALSPNAVGWDWFSLQLADNRELMLYRIRLRNGTDEPTSDGTLVEADGSTQHLTLADFSITPLNNWRSPATGITYPSAWTITIRPPGSNNVPIVLTVRPLLPNQELHNATTYWEGASQVSGTQGETALNGYGYVELTGYDHIDRAALPVSPTANPLAQPPH